MVTAPQNQGRRLRTLAYFDQIIFSADMLGKSQLTPTDRIVALGILEYVNRQAGSTYVDLLTLAKRLGILHPTVKTAASCLEERGHLKIAQRPGKTPLLTPVLKECGEHSRRGDKAFYAARGKLIQQLVFDQRLTPAERLGGLAFLATADPETYECESQVYVARNCGLSRDMLYKRALPKLEALGYVARKPDGAVVFDLAVDVEGEALGEVQGEVSKRDKARQMGVSEPNSMNLMNSVLVAGRQTLSLVKDKGDVTLPGAATIAGWRAVYPFLMADGPLGMIENDAVACYLDAGFLIRAGRGQFDYTITPLGDAVSGREAVSKKEAAA